MLSHLTGKSTELLSFNEVSQKLKAGDAVEHGLQEIPLEAIVGSVARYEDFTRDFLPRRDSDKERWARVQTQLNSAGLANMPPILVYQIGQVYFVIDGNHRVSVSRRLGATHIKAYVTQLQTKVNLSAEDQAADLTRKAEYTDFLEHTGLDSSRPQADLTLTIPGKYWILEAQIEAHRYLSSATAANPISFQEAAVYWYDGVYSGVAQIIRDRALLQNFPERTETDLYVWVFEHRAALKQQLEWDMGSNSVLTDLAVQQGRTALIGVKRLGHQALQAVTPDQLASGPETGLWQSEKSAIPHQSRLFFNLLVAITGEEKGWQALEQSLEIARREHGRLRGLHLVAGETQKRGPAAKAIRDEFNRRCQAANISGKLAIETGPAVDKICERAWLADLVVAPLLHPPGAHFRTRLSSEFRTLIQRSARPVLAIPEMPSSFSRALLAYDGSPKAKEALFVATYLLGRWKVPLVVLTASERNSTNSLLEAEVSNYMEERGVQATFIGKKGQAGRVILETAEAFATDLIIMGGYSRSPVKDLVLGSSVDEVLSGSKHPVLICR
jgi:nucleotide-binding universal stress UspA family protein